MTWRVTRLPAPDADAVSWLAALNACFPGWGGEARFDWCFRRAGAGRLPDALFLAEGGRTVAGSAVSYRTLELGDGRRVAAGIMTGSWTLPEARGRGAFAHLIEDSRAAASAREAPLLLAFVTDTNASLRRLQAAGATLFPSFYCRAIGPPSEGADVRDLGEPDASVFRAPRDGRARLVYDAEEWRGQFVARPAVVRTVGREARFAALVEAAADLRILAVAAALRKAAPDETVAAYAALARHAARSGRAAFAFATRGDIADSLAGAGFAVAARGFVAILPSSAATVADALGAPDEAGARRLLDLDLEDGDRM